MADVTLRTIDEPDGHEGMFLHAGKALRITTWGMNVLKLPAGWDDYPEHDHSEDGHEEVCVTLEGSATLEADGETWLLEPGSMARVGAAQKRKIAPGDDGVVLLAIGGASEA